MKTETNTDRRTDPQMTRRGLMKTAGVAGGAAAIGAGVPNGFSPVQRSQAFPVTSAVAITVGAMAGAAVVSWLGPNADVDPNKSISDQLYLAADSVAKSQQDTEQELKQQWDISNPDATPYANFAWSEIRVQVAKARLEGESQSVAIQRATDALNEQTIRSVINIVENWNTFVNSLVEQFAYDIAGGHGVFTYEYNGNPITEWSSGVKSDWEKEIIDVEVDGTKYDIVGVLDADKVMNKLPVPTDSIDERDEPLEIFAFSGSPAMLPVVSQNTSSSSITAFSDQQNFGTVYGGGLNANTSNFSKVSVFDGEPLETALRNIETAHNNIKNDLSTYVSTLYNSFAEGKLDPSSLISPQDLYDDFANAASQQRMTAELIAVGAANPADPGYRVKVSHPDLVDPPQWGVLFPMFAKGTTEKDLVAGTTISSSEYKMAYLGFPAADTGEWETRLLSGDSDLQILETEDRDSDFGSERGSQSAGTNGSVVVWNTDKHGEAPDPLKFPSNNQDWKIRIVGAQNTSTHAIDEPTKGTDNGADVWTVDPTDLNEGETVESVTIKKPANYTQTSEFVSDPNTVDGDKLEQKIKAYQELKENLEELDSGGIGGGGFFDGFSLFGLGTLETIAVLILGLLGVNAATN